MRLYARSGRLFGHPLLACEDVIAFMQDRVIPRPTLLSTENRQLSTGEVLWKGHQGHGVPQMWGEREHRGQGLVGVDIDRGGVEREMVRDQLPLL